MQVPGRDAGQSGGRMPPRPSSEAEQPGRDAGQSGGRMPPRPRRVSEPAAVDRASAAWRTARRSRAGGSEGRMPERTSHAAGRGPLRGASGQGVPAAADRQEAGVTASGSRRAAMPANAASRGEPPERKRGWVPGWGAPRSGGSQPGEPGRSEAEPATWRAVERPLPLARRRPRRDPHAAEGGEAAKRGRESEASEDTRAASAGSERGGAATRHTTRLRVFEGEPAGNKLERETTRRKGRPRQRARRHRPRENQPGPQLLLAGLAARESLSRQQVIRQQVTSTRSGDGEGVGGDQRQAPLK